MFHFVEAGPAHYSSQLKLRAGGVLMLSKLGCGGQKVPDGGPIIWSRGWFEAFKDHKMASSRLSVSTGPNKLVSKHVYSGP